MAEPQQIRIEMTDDAAELHRRVFPHIARYAESPADFEPATHGVISNHLAWCEKCRDEFNKHNDRGR